MLKKEYLADGVYAEVDDLGSLILTTENGISVTNRIVLDEYTYEALMKFLKKAAKTA